MTNSQWISQDDIHILQWEAGQCGYARRLKGVYRAIGSINNNTGYHIPQFTAVQGLALAGFGKLEFNNCIWLVIDLDLEAFSQVTGIVHSCNPSSIFTKVNPLMILCSHNRKTCPRQVKMRLRVGYGQ